MSTLEKYIENLADDRKVVIEKLRNVIQTNLPKGFEECINYGMIGYVVPHTIYPKGYHCDTKLPLPFLNIASQKNSVNLYHMGMYANKELYDWFVSEFPKHASKKLDIGKSCIRFKYLEDIPYELIGALVQKMGVLDWITVYEQNFVKK
jgi:uncharacterized protein YdhG (YjbR/CyaY superfamily)